MSIAHLLSFSTFLSSGGTPLNDKAKSHDASGFLYENSRTKMSRGTFFAKRNISRISFSKKNYFPFSPGEARASAPQRSDTTVYRLYPISL